MIVKITPPQHHDGITGTVKDHVVLDYWDKMVTAIRNLQEVNLKFENESKTAIQNSKIGLFCMWSYKEIERVLKGTRLNITVFFYLYF